MTKAEQQDGELERLMQRLADQPMNRRGFLYATGLAGSSALLAACTPGGTSSPSTAASPAPSASAVESQAASASPSAATVTHDNIESEFNLYNWVDYDAPETHAGFEQEYNTKIILDIFDSNEIALAKFQAGGGAGYDVVAPTGYII